MQAVIDALQNQLINLVNSLYLPSALLRPINDNSGSLIDFEIIAINKSASRSRFLNKAPGNSILERVPSEISGKLFAELRNLYKDNTVLNFHMGNTKISGARTGDYLVINWSDSSAGKKQNKKIEALKASNEELEQFAYLASHDLQEPLRMVISFTQLLQRRYAGKLDQDADEFISFAVSGAQRMKELIDTLLQYSRISSKVPRLVNLNTELLVKEVINDLSESVQKSGVTIYMENLPEVVAEKTLLKVTFANLISNAIKYGDINSPYVTVSAEPSENEWLFSVSDNGIGIDPQYYDKIFLIFHRLHGRDSYPGTGIGLAICKKSIEKLGGRIWVESAPGEGSVFYFTIPYSE